MTKTERIKIMLEAKGIECSIEKVEKMDGHARKALVVGTGEVRPIFYVEEMEVTDQEIIDYILSNYKNKKPPITTEDIIIWEKAKKKIKLGVRPCANDNVVTKPYLDLQLYTFIEFEDDEMTGRIAVRCEILDCYGITKDELFDAAEKNTVYKFSGFGEFGLSDSGLIMGTVDSASGNYGASIIACKTAIKTLSDISSDDIYIIPSSIHECLFAPCRFIDSIALLNMIEDTNNTCVDECDRLSYSVYRYVRDTNQVIIERKNDLYS